ncbi:MAG: succinate dehydrogenase assembly factor 2 [Rhodanobacteraceae bacterium]
MHPQDSQPIDPGRLRWRCRRGTRELDALLGWWLDARFPGADTAQREDFAAMLETPDPDLWNWLIGQEPAAPRFAHIVDEIRFRDRV